MTASSEATPASDDLGSSPSDDLLRELARTADAPPPDLRPGDLLDRFRIVRPIGRGGMGAVYLAQDQRLARTVALKVLHPRSLARGDRRKRFLREARAAAAVQHDEVARILEVGDVEGRVFLVFEHVAGRTLRARMGEGPPPLPEIVAIGRALCRALEAAHAAGVVHRDLKPENVMLTEEGQIKVLDFGLAQRLPTSAPAEPGSDVATVEGQVLGSPGYMSPEQALASGTDHRSDLFSLGVVLFELVAGRRPFAGANAMETLVATSRDRAPDVRRFAPRAPAALARIIARCLETDRERRPASAAAVDRELALSLSSAQRGRLLPVGVVVAALGGMGAWLWVSSLGDAAPGEGPDPSSPTPGPAVADATTPDARAQALPSASPPSSLDPPAPRPPEPSAIAPSSPPTSRPPPARPSRGPTAPPAAPPPPPGAPEKANWRSDPSFAEQK